MAVTRYFAKKFDLVPKDPYEAALCDEYVDAVRDLMPGYFILIANKNIKMAIYFTKVKLTPNICFSGFYGALLTEDPAEKETKLAETVKNAKAKYLGVYDSLIKSNDGIHLVTSSLTWADICLAYVMDQVFLLLGVDLTEGYPNIKALKDNVFNTKGIKEWVEKRPKTKY